MTYTVKVPTFTALTAVATLREASDAVRKAIDDNCLRSSELKKRDGNVYQDGKHVATISYNGRIWDLNGNTIIN